MTYTPGFLQPQIPLVSTFGVFGFRNTAQSLLVTTIAPSSATWETANLTVWTPVFLPCVHVLTRVWWANGATVSGGATVQVGIYADLNNLPDVKIVSGSAVQGSAAVLQFVDVTDTVLSPGRYWMALTASTTTNTTFYRSSMIANYNAARRFEQASAMPSTATPVESAGLSLWVCGFSTTTVT